MRSLLACARHLAMSYKSTLAAVCPEIDLHTSWAPDINSHPKSTNWMMLLASPMADKGSILRVAMKPWACGSSQSSETSRNDCDNDAAGVVFAITLWMIFGLGAAGAQPPLRWSAAFWGPTCTGGHMMNISHFNCDQHT